MMPLMDGFEVLDRIRTRRVAVSVIMLTALHGSSHKRRAQRGGAVDYVTKPFDVVRLAELVVELSPTGAPSRPDLVPLAVRQLAEPRRLEPAVAAISHEAMLLLTYWKTEWLLDSVNSLDDAAESLAHAALARAMSLVDAAEVLDLPDPVRLCDLAAAAACPVGDLLWQLHEELSQRLGRLDCLAHANLQRVDQYLDRLADALAEGGRHHQSNALTLSDIEESEQLTAERCRQLLTRIPPAAVRGFVLGPDDVLPSTPGHPRRRTH